MVQDVEVWSKRQQNRQNVQNVVIILIKFVEQSGKLLFAAWTQPLLERGCNLHVKVHVQGLKILTCTCTCTMIIP